MGWLPPSDLHQASLIGPTFSSIFLLCVYCPPMLVKEGCYFWFFRSSKIVTFWVEWVVSSQLGGGCQLVDSRMGVPLVGMTDPNTFPGAPMPVATAALTMHPFPPFAHTLQTHREMEPCISRRKMRDPCSIRSKRVPTLFCLLLQNWYNPFRRSNYSWHFSRGLTAESV